MPQPYRRCSYVDERGAQCEKWFPAIDNSKLCPAHKEIISPNGNGITEDNKVKYIDLVNDQRHYCYHFQDGTAQHQKQTLIFEFIDDTDGSVFEKLDNHIAFLDKVIADLRARHQATRAVRGEKLDTLSEEERKVLRAHKIEKAVKEPSERKKREQPDMFEKKKDFLSKNNISKMDMLALDEDALLAKFAEAKRKKLEESLKGE